MAESVVKMEDISDEEWTMRVELAACYSLFVRYGWTDMIFTHLSARVPGEDNLYLINPYGLLFDEITASSLIKVDFDGSVSFLSLSTEASPPDKILLLFFSISS